MFEVDTVHSLSTLPANDGNFKSSLDRATNDEILSAIAEMKANGGKNKGRILACERELRRRKKNEPCNF